MTTVPSTPEEAYEVDEDERLDADDEESSAGRDDADDDLLDAAREAPPMFVNVEADEAFRGSEMSDDEGEVEG